LSPESVDYFGSAERILADAEIILQAGRNEVAAREAYSVMLQATRAIIFEKTGQAPKTHSGARSELSRLIREGLTFDGHLAGLLATGFDTKADVDYGPRTAISQEVAERAVEDARTFLAAARKVCE